MPLYTTYTPEEAIRIVKFLIIYAVTYFGVVGWLWWKNGRQDTTYSITSSKWMSLLRKFYGKDEQKLINQEVSK